LKFEYGSVGEISKREMNPRLETLEKKKDFAFNLIWA
jgi:hypothetical protein